MKIRVLILATAALLGGAFCLDAQVPLQSWVNIINSQTNNQELFINNWFALQRIAINSNGDRIAFTGKNNNDISVGCLNSNSGQIIFNHIVSAPTEDYGAIVRYDNQNNLCYMGLQNTCCNGTNGSGQRAYIGSLNPTGGVNYGNQIPANAVRAIPTTFDINKTTQNSYTYQITANAGSYNSSNLVICNNQGTIINTNTISDLDWFYGNPSRSIMDNNNNIIFGGKFQYQGQGTPNYEIVLRKINPQGNTMWTTRIRPYISQYISELMTDNNSDVFVTYNPGSGYNDITKISGATGTVIWRRRLNNLTGNNFPKLTILPNGNAVVSFLDSIKCYNGSSGNLLWARKGINLPTIGERQIDHDVLGNIYEIHTDSILVLSEFGNDICRFKLTIPGRTVSLQSILIDNANGVFYLAGNTSNGVASKMFIAKYGSLPNQCNISATISPATLDLTPGGSAAFNATAAGAGITYRWQSNPSQVGWFDVPNNATYSGGQTNALTMSNVQLGNHQQQFRVIATVGNCADTSEVAFIQIHDTCTITVNDTVSVSVTDTLYLAAPLGGAGNTVRVFPNATFDHLTIDYGNFALLNGYTLQITNALGQAVFSTPIAQQSDYLDLYTWGGNGTYTLSVLDPQQQTVASRVIVLQ
jgi:hypothetical protein